jgi:hypothetical protein
MTMKAFLLVLIPLVLSVGIAPVIPFSDEGLLTGPRLYPREGF